VPLDPVIHPATVADVEDAPQPPVEHGSPHSRGLIALRVLGAIAVAAAAFAVQRLVLADDEVRRTYGAKVRTKEIESSRLERTMDVKVVVPKGAPPKGRSLVIFLHGRDEDENSYLVDPMFRALADLKTRAPVMAFPDGGDSSYWHDRESGEWGSYVLYEVLPTLIDRFDIDPSRVAIAGISMGGFGALDLARLAPGRFCAVAAHSPAIWENAGDTADGAFDDAADFDRNDVVAIAGEEPNPYRGLHMWIDAGDDDPFLDGDAALEDALRSAGVKAIVRSGPGGHDSDYWNGNWKEYLTFYSRALRHCGEPEEEKQRKNEQRDGSKDAKGDRP
jgi:S-formylglutathione hydrolase FrmB